MATDEIPVGTLPVYWKDVEPEWNNKTDVCGYISNGTIHFFSSVARLLYQKNGLSSDVECVDDAQHAYFMRADNGLIKIGKSTHVEHRLAQLKTLSPVDIVLINTPLCDASESELHERFAHLRHHGEWFTPDVELCEYIESVGGDLNAL